MIIIFVIVNIAHHILTVNLYFHNLQIFHNYILSCRRIISYVFSHSTGACKCSRTIRTLLPIYSPMISHINICTSISIAYHIKNEVLCIHRTSSDTQIVSSPCHCHNSCILLSKHIIYNFIQMHTIRAFDQHDIFRLHHRKQIQSNLAVVLEAVTVDI